MRTSVRAWALGLYAGILSMLVATPAAAQPAQAGASVPDYAAILGSQQVVKDPVTGVRRGLTQAEVQQRIDAQGTTRSERQRRESQAINKTLHALPATVADSFRQAKPNSQGIVVVKTAREEIQPIVGVIEADGGLKASHDPADAAPAIGSGERP
ncbi:hypothetical protein PRJ39_06705 [Lysobacter enzymogenes]|uniref:hypothetical protein n=1 Tax=Lysobacter enzymogenes TaxID=69 RepID=UPI00374A2C8A